MAEFQHYSSWKESIELLRAVIEEHQLKLILRPNKLTAPVLETYSAVDDKLVQELGAHADVLLEGPFSKHPLRFSAHGEKMFFVVERYGQRLMWSLSTENLEQDGRLRINPGALSYLPTYRDPVTEELEPASPALKATFKAVVATLKRRMVKVHVRNDSIWVARETKRDVDAGALFIDRWAVSDGS